MNGNSESRTGTQWSSRFVFIMAAAGAAIGLANIWKFPYTAGSHGGGAFVLVYLVAIFALSIPILITELVLGRLGKAHGPSTNIANVAKASGVSTTWRGAAVAGVLAAVMVLSFYFVIFGWVAHYAFQLALGKFSGSTASEIANAFTQTSSNPWLTTFWHTVAVLLTWLVVVMGMKRGLERVAKFGMPILFVLVILNVLLAGYFGQFTRAIEFLFKFDTNALTLETIYYACGQAFFTVGAGSCVMVVFGSYLNDEVSIIGSAVRIAVLDTGVALLAGLAAFPLVFQYGLDPGEGPGLLFVTLPIAFSSTPGGPFIGAIFFTMVGLAALTSAIAIAQPPVEFIRQNLGWSRFTAASIVLGGIWLLGLGTVCSFSSCTEFYPLGWLPSMFGPITEMNIFKLMETLAINICLPLGSLILALFVGWRVPFTMLAEPLGGRASKVVHVWYFMIRYIVPPIIVVVMIAGFLE